MPENSYSCYCPNCVKNVPHFRRIRMMGLRWLDDYFDLALGKLRIGPWYCLHCERRTLVRRSPRDSAANYRIVDPEDLEMAQSSTWVKASPDRSASQSENDSTREANVDLPVGNFIKNEKSLVVRMTRLLRFSEKYRDSVVERILHGDLTISDIRHEKDLSEREVLDWIADRVYRLETQLEEKATAQDPPMLQIISDDSADQKNNRAN